MKRRMTIWAFLAGLPVLALADGPKINWNTDPMTGFRQALAEKGTRLSKPEKGKTSQWGKERVDASRARREGGLQGAPVRLAHNRNRSRGQFGFGIHSDRGFYFHYSPYRSPYGYSPYHRYSPYRYQDPFHRYSSPYRRHYGPHNQFHYDPYNGLHYGPHWGSHRRH